MVPMIIIAIQNPLLFAAQLEDEAQENESSEKKWKPTHCQHVLGKQCFGFCHADNLQQAVNAIM